LAGAAGLPTAGLPTGLPLPTMPGLLPGLPSMPTAPEMPTAPPVKKTPPAPPQTPTQAPNGDQILGTFLGVVRVVNEDQGFGFITSDQLRDQGINEDCYVHKHYLGRDYSAGSEVSFTAFLDARNGRPRAKDLKDATGKVGPQSTMMAPAGGQASPEQKDDSIGTYKGTVKSYNAMKGFGFIVCPELQKEGWDGDIYLQRKNTNDMPFKSGDYVSFEAFIFQGRLQGRNPVKIDPPLGGATEAEGWQNPPWEENWKGDAKGKFKGAKGKGKGAVGLNPMAMNMMMAMMGMGGKG